MQIVITIESRGARLILCAERHGEPASPLETVLAAVVHADVDRTIRRIGQTLQLGQVGRVEIAEGEGATRMKDETLNGPAQPPVPRPDASAN